MTTLEDKKKQEEAGGPEGSPAPPADQQHQEHEEAHHDAAAPEIDPAVTEILGSAPHEKVILQKNKPFYRKFTVTNGDQIAYQFTMKKKDTVSFSIMFVPETLSAGVELDNDRKLKKFVVTKDKTLSHAAAIYTAEGKGTVVLRWSNSSWLVLKEVVLCTKLKQANLAEIAVENARREVEERQHNADADGGDGDEDADDNNEKDESFQ